ncbi:antitoxin VbhA family protein [Martelella mediterranea]|uniref:antitoxin VbhA family protein n=1 Tax=Martelella mediterranea TaxID=293089 RepID=UPI001E39B397|nr:antitoxin VbhA family protein [Martelella mediterranea]MCD1635860.1 antitoxin VbhA family protein [Martelella mediterranea]
MASTLEKTRISDAEMEQRRRLVDSADHSNAMEGLKRDPATDHIFEAFVRGEIEASDIVPMLKEFRAANG